MAVVRKASRVSDEPIMQPSSTRQHNGRHPIGIPKSDLVVPDADDKTIILYRSRRKIDAYARIQYCLLYK